MGMERLRSAGAASPSYSHEKEIDFFFSSMTAPQGICPEEHPEEPPKKNFALLRPFFALSSRQTHCAASDEEKKFFRSPA